MARKSRKNVEDFIPHSEDIRCFNAAIYVRLSREEQEGFRNHSSFKNQKAFLLDYVEKHPEINVYKVYEDNGYSGTNFDRPGFSDMIVKDSETKKLFDNIQKMIDSLSDANKEKIGVNEEDTEYKDRLTRFAAAQKKYDALNTSAEVAEMIKALGNPEELTEANLESKKTAVKAAEDAYELLAETEKLNVENYSALKNWKEAIDNFFVDHSGDINGDGEVDIDDIYAMIQFVLGRKTPTDEQFERANIVKSTDGSAEEIDIFDVLAAIDLIEF